MNPYITAAAPLVDDTHTIQRLRRALPHLGSGVRLDVNRLTATLGVDTFPAFVEDHVDLHVHQQRDDEGDVEGHDGGVDHKRRVRKLTHGRIPSCCKTT